MYDGLSATGTEAKLTWKASGSVFMSQIVREYEAPVKTGLEDPEILRDFIEQLYTFRAQASLEDPQYPSLEIFDLPLVVEEEEEEEGSLRRNLQAEDGNEIVGSSCSQQTLDRHALYADFLNTDHQVYDSYYQTLASQIYDWMVTVN